MKILAFECSASAASCCVYEDGKILGSCYSNVFLTHSQTLMPMAESLLESVRLTIDDIDCFAVANGPGSFTGIRIGISAVKGLALAKDKPCIPVSTLEAMAHLLSHEGAVVCPVMDARCGQVYNALFGCSGGNPVRLCEDRAIAAEQLSAELKALGEPVILIGDGAEMFYSKFGADNITLAPEHLRYQNAVGVAFAAKAENAVKAGQLLPFYLRLPQAERELRRAKNKPASPAGNNLP